MGWKSTVDISKSEALAQLTDVIHSASLPDLEDLMDRLVGNGIGHTYNIIPDGDDND